MAMLALANALRQRGEAEEADKWRAAAQCFAAFGRSTTYLDNAGEIDDGDDDVVV